jgi:hypothetical protein
MGVKREEIFLEAQLKNEFFFDEIELNCFMFFIESDFHITLNTIDEID